MTIAAKINLMFLAIALLLATILTGYTAWREHQIVLDRTVAAVMARMQGQPDLQLEIYRRDESSLQRLLAGFLQTPAVSVAIARDSLEEVLARRESSAASRPLSPPFKLLRGEMSPAETGLTALNRNLDPVGTGLWTLWTESELMLYLTAPVLTSVNPAQQGLSAYDFFVAPGMPEANSSLRIIGYMQFEIARSELLDSITPAVSKIFFISMGLIAFSGLAIALITRRITRDISHLAKLAEEVASGTLAKPVEIKASGEIKEIAQVFNSVIGGFLNYKKESDVGQRLLSMKVEENSSQLSERDAALNKATEEINETRSRLQQLAYYDNLTTLPNRRLFTEQLELLLGLNRRSGQTLALLFVNLDNFKRVNDSLGHSAGDQVLLEVGRRLSESVRESDAVAHHTDGQKKIDVSRLGGDEFTVILNQLNSVDSAAVVAQRILESLQRPMTIEGHELVVSPSIGIALAPRDGAEVEALLRAADIAMHHAKESVRHSFMHYNEQMDASGVERLGMEADLRHAIERGELTLHYQPQINSLSGAVVGAEALLRWEHPKHGMVPPFQFISLAEEIGVIGELGDWVLAEACRQLKEFDALGLSLPRVAINVSAFQFTSTFVQRVSEVLAQYELPASRLELGLSEAILTDQDRSTFQSLRDLEALGVYLSIDDFGTGNASLSYFSRYSLNELKIDRSFVQECDRNAKSARLVVAIVAMARSLQLGIVAEGVETESQYRFLVNNGAEVVQGYLFAKPVPANELRRMLAPWHFVKQVQGIQV